MKLIPRLLILTCVLVCAVCKTLPIPAYITACNANDPNLNECATKNGRAAIPTLIKGDRKYRIPVLDPLVIDELTILNGNGSVAIELFAKNVQIVGFKDMTLKSTQFDLTKNVIKLEIFSPKMLLLGDYTVKGNVLILPITGSGFMNISLENVDLSYTLKYNLVKKADGLQYVVPSNNNMGYATTKVHYLFENLFNGNKLLSDNMNNFMNENWKIIADELGPSVAETLGNALHMILAITVQDIPYKDIFPTKS